MENSSIEKIGEYEGLPVYYDKSSAKYVYCVRGATKDSVFYVGPAVINHESRTITLPDGSPLPPQNMKYENKAFIVGTKDMKEAKESIDLYLAIRKTEK